MLKIAIIGCGKIADQHIEAIRSVPRSDIIAACDLEELMAMQLCERQNIPNTFTNHHEMLESCKPDIVHITTPPPSHFKLAKECMESGSSVYVEKPFTIDTPEAEQLIQIAKDSGRKITVGHNLQFSDEAIRMRELCTHGAIGPSVNHIEVIQGYSLKTDYAKAFLADQNHWLHKLPGKLAHNLMSHGIAKISEHLTGSDISLAVDAYTSSELKNLGEESVKDEIRVMFRDEKNTTAYYIFTSQIGAGNYQMRLYGQRGAMSVNQANRSVIVIGSRSYKAQLNYIFPLFKKSKLYRKEAFKNIKQFFSFNLRLDAGMRRLIKYFYNSVEHDSPPPIPYDQIVRTASLIDGIIKKVYE